MSFEKVEFTPEWSNMELSVLKSTLWICSILSYLSCDCDCSVEKALCVLVVNASIFVVVANVSQEQIDSVRDWDEHHEHGGIRAPHAFRAHH